jgi:hypothetical protein
MIMLARAYFSSRSGFVTAIQMAKLAPSAPVENHLRPWMTHSCPWRTAVVESHAGFEPALSGSVIVNVLRTSPRTSGNRKRSF